MFSGGWPALAEADLGEPIQPPLRLRYGLKGRAGPRCTGHGRANARPTATVASDHAGEERLPPFQPKHVRDCSPGRRDVARHGEGPTAAVHRLAVEGPVSLAVVEGRRALPPSLTRGPWARYPRPRNSAKGRYWLLDRLPACCDRRSRPHPPKSRPSSPRRPWAGPWGKPISHRGWSPRFFCPLQAVFHRYHKTLHGRNGRSRRFCT